MFSLHGASKSLVTVLVLAAAFGAAPATGPADSEAAYTDAIDKRVSDIIAATRLPDSPAADRVRHTLLDRYRELRAWHDANDDHLRGLGYRPEVEVTQAGLGDAAGEIKDILATQHGPHVRFVDRLHADLTPDQVEVVKNKMTYGKLDVTYNAYLAVVPGLTADEKTQIRDLLIAAREEAMDGGSSEEKAAIFKLYKNRCKAYLTGQGHDVEKAYRDWGAAQKRKAATTGAAMP